VGREVGRGEEQRAAIRESHHLEYQPRAMDLQCFANAVLFRIATPRSTRQPMLNEDRSAGVWKVRSKIFLTDYEFRRRGLSIQLHPKSARAAIERQKAEPVRICERNGRRWWWYQDRFYWEDTGLEKDDVLALLHQANRARQTKLERAHAEMRGDRQAGAREPIPESVRHEVWRRDEGRCVDCGSREKLEFDQSFR
jgi:5-methylcytosine-specific restriction endonuclease McrA